MSPQVTQGQILNLLYVSQFNPLLSEHQKRVLKSVKMLQKTERYSQLYAECFENKTDLKNSL